MNEIKQNAKSVKTLEDLGTFANYSLMDTLTVDPDAKT